MKVSQLLETTEPKKLRPLNLMKAIKAAGFTSENVHQTGFITSTSNNITLEAHYDYGKDDKTYITRIEFWKEWSDRTKGNKLEKIMTMDSPASYKEIIDTFKSMIAQHGLDQ